MWRKMVTDTQAHRQTDRNVKYRPRPVQGLGWVKIYTELQKHQVSASVVNKTNLPMSLLII